MSVRKIPDPLAGERIVALSPENATEASLTRSRRPNLFPGRALTAATLAQAQRWQTEHIAGRGRDWSAGVVDGLVVAFDLLPAPAGFGGVRLSVGKGSGLAVSGEDAVLGATLDCLLADLPVVAPAGLFVDASGMGPASGGETPGTLRARGVGAALGTLNDAAVAAMGTVGVLVLQPVQIDDTPFDANDPCDRCGWPTGLEAGEVQSPVSFEDARVADAVRLLWYPWPQEWRPLPGALPERQWRNALAWTIFDAEAGLPADASLPWEDWGVPLALVALGADRRPVWLDRASVVRRGGRVRSAQLQTVGGALGANPRLPPLWQARIEQFAESVAAEGLTDPFTLARSFTLLPPFGLLPANAFDADIASDTPAPRSDFFPFRFDLDAVPVPVDQLDVALRQNAGLAPLDLNAAESVRVLVPVPLASWEPNLLKRETIDPLFQQTIDRFVFERARALGARQGLRNEQAMLGRAISGKPQTVAPINDDTNEEETLSPWGPPPAGGGHRNPARDGLHAFSFDNATDGFSVADTDAFFVWTYLDPDQPPATLLFGWRNADGDLATVCWGEAPDDATPRLGELPEAGRWIKLTVAVTTTGLPLASGSATLSGMSFGLIGGQAAFGAAGAYALASTTPGPRVPAPTSLRATTLAIDSSVLRTLILRRPLDRVWFANVLPAGARVSAQSESDDPWDPLSDNDLWAPFDPAGGVVPNLPSEVPAGDGGHTEPSALGLHQHYFDGASATLTIEFMTQQLYVWVYLDGSDPPSELMLQWRLNGSWEHRAYWGRDLIGWGKTNTVSRMRIGSLPAPGAWVRLTVPVTSVGLAAGNVVDGMAFTLYNGVAAFADAGVLDGNGNEQPWFSGSPPAGATQRGNWQFLDRTALYAPTPGARIGQVEAVRDLLNDPALAALSGEERAQLSVRGLAGFVDYLRARIDRADDLTDYGFLKMQTDVYRLRQIMLGSEANRLAVSPALATIAKAETAVATEAQLADYVARLKK